MNSAALATTTHRKMEGMSDGISTQVGVRIINKCKATMASRRLYKKGSPHEEGHTKKRRRTEKELEKLKGRTSKYLSHLLGLRMYGR